MPDPSVPKTLPPVTRLSPVDPSKPCRAEADDKMICERCGTAEMYRMHAVWRCPACGFKTDCCGW